MTCSISPPISLSPPRSTEWTTTAGSNPSAPNPTAETYGKGPTTPNFGSTYTGSAQRFHSRPSTEVRRSSGSNAAAPPARRRARITIANSMAYSATPVLRPTMFSNSPRFIGDTVRISGRDRNRNPVNGCFLPTNGRCARATPSLPFIVPRRTLTAPIRPLVLFRSSAGPPFVTVPGARSLHERKVDCSNIDHPGLGDRRSGTRAGTWRSRHHPGHGERSDRRRAAGRDCHDREPRLGPSTGNDDRRDGKVRVPQSATKPVSRHRHRAGLRNVRAGRGRQIRGADCARLEPEARRHDADRRSHRQSGPARSQSVRPHRHRSDAHREITP